MKKEKEIIKNAFTVRYRIRSPKAIKKSYLKVNRNPQNPERDQLLNRRKKV